MSAESRWAIRVDAPGGFEKLRWVRLPCEVLRPGEVRVRTESIGVNFADCVVRMGLYESAKKYVGWPIVPGFEFCGTVIECAPGVDLAPGQQVVGITRFGGYATEVVVPAEQVFELPQGWSAREAGGFSVTTLTAWYALRELCKLRAGDRVLVHSAAGGVGLAAMSIVRACGAEAIGVVGAPHKCDAATHAGAAHVIDRSNCDWERALSDLAPGGVDVVLDPNGAATLRASYRHLGPAGRLVIYGFHEMFSRGSGRPNWPKLIWQWLRTPRFDPLQMTNHNKGVLAFNLSYLFDRLDVLAEALRELQGWAEQGLLRPSPTTSFALSDAAEAHRALQGGATVGKLVLVP